MGGCLCPSRLLNGHPSLFPSSALLEEVRDCLSKLYSASYEAGKLLQRTPGTDEQKFSSFG